MLLEPAPRAGGEPGKLVLGGAFDLALEEPGDQPVRHRAPRQAAWAQLLHGDGGRIRQITPGQTPHTQEFEDFRAVPSRGPARPQPAIQIAGLRTCRVRQLPGHTRRQIVRGFQEPTGLAVVHEFHRARGCFAARKPSSAMLSRHHPDGSARSDPRSNGHLPAVPASRPSRIKRQQSNASYERERATFEARL